MFVIPLAMSLGAPITLGTFITKNLIPATIGNLIGGGIFVAMAFGLSFGNWEKAICAATSNAAAHVAPGLSAKLLNSTAPLPHRSGQDSSNTSSRDAIARIIECQSAARHSAQPHASV